jgi:hypothetical protein
MVEEMDLGAVLARRPRVALVDDLVHGNAPDAHHAYPWQDVEGLLAAGIEVISAVSIGHLASLADVVAKTTGAALRRPSRSRSSARQARSSWWVRRRRYCASGWPAATFTRPECGGGAGRLVPDREPASLRCPGFAPISARGEPAVLYERAGNAPMLLSIPSGRPKRWWHAAPPGKTPATCRRPGQQPGR